MNFSRKAFNLSPTLACSITVNKLHHKRPHTAWGKLKSGVEWKNVGIPPGWHHNLLTAAWHNSIAITVDKRDENRMVWNCDRVSLRLNCNASLTNWPKSALDPSKPFPKLCFFLHRLLGESKQIDWVGLEVLFYGGWANGDERETIKQYDAHI